MIFNTTIRTVQGGGSGGDGSVIEGELFLTADGEEFLTADNEQFITSQDRLVDVSKFPSSPSEEIVYKTTTYKDVTTLYAVKDGVVINVTEIKAKEGVEVEIEPLWFSTPSQIQNPTATTDTKIHIYFLLDLHLWTYDGTEWTDWGMTEYGLTHTNAVITKPPTADMTEGFYTLDSQIVNVSYGIPTAENEVWKYVAGSENAFIYMVSGGVALQAVSYFNIALGLGLLGYKVVNNESEIDKLDAKYIYVVKSTKMFFVYLINNWQSVVFTEVENKDSIPSADGAYGYYYGGQKKWVSFDAEIDKLKEQLSEADGAKNFMSYAQLTPFGNGIELDNITNRNISSIEIHPSITRIGYSSFDGCKYLTSVIIPDNVIEIDHYAFKDCTSLKSLVLGNSVTTIGIFTFENCTSLTSIEIPDSVTSIGRSAFSNCNSLTSVEIGDKVTSIGSYAFKDCTSLTSVVIPDSVPMIDVWTFAGCTNLTSVVIPNSVTEIDVSAFRDCTNLTDITYNGTQTQWNSITKGADWNTNTGNYTIHCTDGDIAKS